MMTNGDREGWIFLSHPLTNNELFFLLTTKYRILYWILYAEGFKTILNTLRRDPMTSWINVKPACSPLFFIFPMGWYGYVLT